MTEVNFKIEITVQELELLIKCLSSAQFGGTIDQVEPMIKLVRSLQEKLTKVKNG